MPPNTNIMDLLYAFTSYENCRHFFQDLSRVLYDTDSTVAVLALEGLYRIEEDIQRRQFVWDSDPLVHFQTVLRLWRNTVLLRVRYYGDTQRRLRARTVLQSLTVFKTLGVSSTSFDGLGGIPLYHCESVDLLGAFSSRDACRATFRNLIRVFNNTNPVVSVLALEGLYRLERDLQRSQFVDDKDILESFREVLRLWRNNAPLCSRRYVGGGMKKGQTVSAFRKSLTVFKTLEVPMFLHPHGDKLPLYCFVFGMEPILIHGRTPISHVTHGEESKKIVNEGRFRPSDDNNVIGGCWFGYESTESVYGSKSFSTTLYNLGITGLRQGEIVSYKNKTNVILYAARDRYASFEGLVKPSAAFVRAQRNNPNAYIQVSVFVPSRFLTKHRSKFLKAVKGPVDIRHGHFCFRANLNCEELNR